MIKILTIIPARSGSKGLPDKNIKILVNKPLIAWSILAAKKSKYVDKVMDKLIKSFKEQVAAEVR